jgi:hypothetical protein
LRFSFLLVILISLFSSLGFAQKSPAMLLTEQNYRSLSARVHEILRYRLQGLNQCDAETSRRLMAAYVGLRHDSIERDDSVRALAVYLSSFKVNADCKKKLDSAEMNFFTLERKKFSFVGAAINPVCGATITNGSILVRRHCIDGFDQVMADLDPHCTTIQIKNANGLNDPFPCMAGDYMTGRVLVTPASWMSFLATQANFLNRIRAAMKSPQAKTQGLDLWQLYRDTQPATAPLREEFLASLNFYFGSYHSMSAYVRGFHDHIWAFVLMKSQSPETTVDYYVRSRLLVDEYRTIEKKADAAKISFRISRMSLEGKIRHDYMAAFLACHYRNHNVLIRNRLPVALGYAYESLDFKSHIQDGISLKASRENFVTDTNRYRTGARWGYAFCAQKN